MKNDISISIGDRFDYKEQVYEICYNEFDTIRYAEVKGGKMHFITKEDFTKKIITGEINYHEIKKRSTHKNLALNINEVDIYINYITENKISTSQKKLEKAINNVRILNPEIKYIAPSTLARYIRKIKSNNNNKACLYTKAKGNKYPRFSLEIENIINEEISNFIYKKEKYTALDVHDVIKYRIESKDKDAKVPTLRTIYRRLEKIDGYQLTKHKKSKSSADKRFRAAGIENISPSILAIIEIDTHYVDCLIIDDSQNILGRPLICVALDVYSRVIVGWHLCFLAPCATKTLLTLEEYVN